MNAQISRYTIPILVLCSGIAALSWEVLWQIKSTLSLGISAWGTAITLAVTMGGMCVGALIMGQILRNRNIDRPLRLYAVLECIVGLSGLMLAPAFGGIEYIDSLVYANSSENISIVFIAGIIAVLGLPTLAMGATLPVLGLIGRQSHVSIAVLYGLNTLGAACGTLLCAFLLIPLCGIANTILIIAALDVFIGLVAFNLKIIALPVVTEERKASNLYIAKITTLRSAMLIVTATGFATFMLEVAWFRSLTAAFMSTTDAFAIMLSCVLLALGGGAAYVPMFKRNPKISLGGILGWAGTLIILVTPAIERFDLVAYTVAEYPAIVFLQWFALTLYVTGLPMFLLGLAMPWILDDHIAPRRWGALYGLNALAAIVGSVAAGWYFLPTIGFAQTAWVAGAVVALTGIIISIPKRRGQMFLLVSVALIVAWVFESGVGVNRVQGSRNFDSSRSPTRILEAYEGPNATVTAAEYADGGRILFIDGLETTMQADEGKMQGLMHYMPWMGHLPMMAHPAPKQALVICFGTGQTANAVRRENPVQLDIVEINKNILRLAPHFTANEKVLDDARVRTIVMDGRAYIRRTNKQYDVITLEPMPPNFAGVNALYSLEFYEAARGRLTGQGMIAQWLPFHLLTPYYSASIARTFQSVFPNSILWVDPPSGTGILLGSVDDNILLGHSWFGEERAGISRDLSPKEVQEALFLDRDGLGKYGSSGDIVTDDNQLLSYGKATYLLRAATERHENQEGFKKIK